MDIRLFGALELIWRTGPPRPDSPTGEGQAAAGTASLLLPSSPQTQSLLAYLIFYHDRPISRERLVGVFWPERPESRARRALSQALWQIRSSLDAAADRLVATQETVEFCLQPDDWLDVAAFERRAGASSLPELDEALGLYRGDFLEGIYDDWALLERERLRERYLGALERFTTLHKRAGEVEVALSGALRLVAADPLRETAHQELMRLYHLLDRDRAALEQYKALCRFLADELGVEPMPATQALAQEIAGRLEGIEVPYLPLRPPPAPAFEEVDRIKLVGREPERGALLTHLEATIAGQGGLVLVEGEAGVGKTRLLEEMVRDAEWRGVQACWGRGWELADLPAYGVLCQALQAALSPLRVGQIAHFVEGWRLRDLSILLPELVEGMPDLPPAAGLDPGQRRARLLEALAQTILALGSVVPHLIVLEDLQWADDATLSALVSLAGCLSGGSVLVVGSYRGEEARDRPETWEALQALDRVAGHGRLVLDRLTAEQTGELVRRGLGLPGEVPSFAAWVYQETEGNPFFILETLRVLRDEHKLHRDQAGRWEVSLEQLRVAGFDRLLPEGMSQVIERRLARLDDDHRAVLDVAAVLGGDFDFPLLVRATGMAPDAVLEIVRELVTRRFLVEGPTAYRFDHDKLRQAAYAGIEEERRRRYHRRAGRALEELDPDQVEQLAHHFSQAQMWDEAVTCNLRAGRRTRAVYAGTEALEYYDRAIEAWQHLPPAGREGLGFDLYRERGEVGQETGQFEQAGADFRRALELADTIGDQAGQARVLNHLSYLAFQRGAFERGRALARQARVLATELHLTAEIATGLFNQANGMRNQGELEAAVDLYRQAVEMYERVDDPVRLADALNRMGAALCHLGGYAEAQAVMEDSLSIRRRLDDRVGIAYSLVNLSSLHYHRGQFVQAVEVAREALEVSTTNGDPYGQDAALNNLGMALLQLGSPGEAIPLIERALEIGREIGDRPLEPEGLTQLGWAAYRQGEIERARETLALALEKSSVSVNWYQLPLTHLLLARCLQGLDRGEEALAHVRTGLEGAETLDDPWLIGMAYRVMGQVAAHLGEARAGVAPERCFDESLGQLREIGAEAELARCLMAYGLYLRRSPDGAAIQRGAALLNEAQAIFCRLEMAADLAHLEEEIAGFLPPGRVRVRLAAVKAPTGRPLRDDETVSVTWTVDVPEDRIIAGRVPRRRYRLLRLLREAADQGAVPTVADLAEVLEVSTRTIERDLAALREDGHSIQTRGG